MIDFSNCEKILSRAYNGANGKKIAIIYNGAPYMLKFPPSGEDKPTTLSYTNSCISEHIASSIFNILGIEAQQTVLGTYSYNEKTKVVCACRDFTADGSRFFDFCSIKNTVLDSESNGSGTELSEIIDTISFQKYVDPTIVLQHFWDVFAVDAFLGNFDRHNGNWGFLFDEATQKARLAPVYDCGSCLLPLADEKVMQSVLDNEEELNARIMNFPTSAIKLNGKKINYYDFIKSGENLDCARAVKKIGTRIDMAKIYAFIDQVPYISELQKRFYKYYLQARYNILFS